MHQSGKAVERKMTTYLPLPVTTKFEVLATLKGNLLPKFAVGAFHPQDNLLGGLSLQRRRKG